MPVVSALGKLLYYFPFGDEILDNPSNWKRCWQGEEDSYERVSKRISGEHIGYAMRERYSHHVTPKGADP
jgi:hypothetical protein